MSAGEASSDRPAECLGAGVRIEAGGRIYPSVSNNRGVRGLRPRETGVTNVSRASRSGATARKLARKLIQARCVIRCDFGRRLRARWSGVLLHGTSPIAGRRTSPAREVDV